MARFHQDMSKVVSRKGRNESATLLMILPFVIVVQGATKSKNHVKIFDLRSGKDVMSIQQRCINSSPMYLIKQPELCLNKLISGRGAMILDLRAAKQPWYSFYQYKREHECYFCTDTQWSCKSTPATLDWYWWVLNVGRDEEDDAAAWLGKSLRSKI